MSMNYVELKVSELRDECKSRNLDTTGLKVHLVDRLNIYDKNQSLKSKTENKAVTRVSEPTKDNFVEETKVNQNGKTSNTNQSNISENGSHFIDVDLDKSPITTDPSFESNLEDFNKENMYKLAANEHENWETRTDVHLDFYNCDMNLVINENGLSVIPLSEDEFQYVCGGVKGNYGVKSGKVYFEVTILKKCKVELNSDAGDTNFIRIGWSADNESLLLGECGLLSYGYDWAGKTITNGNYSDYGCKSTEGDVIGCFLEFNGDSFVMSFSINGENQGEAFRVLSRELKDHVLMPHIYVKNVCFEVNFGCNGKDGIYPPKTKIEGSEPIEDVTWSLLGRVNLNQRTRSLKPPKNKSECEVLMMCGLPSCGKTCWTEKQIKDHPEKRYNLLSINNVLEKMKVNNLRKKVNASRWDSFILSATQCLNKFMEIAVSRRRNFILDQTNCYPTAQRRRMKPFEEFIRKAIIVVPTDDEYQRRMNQVIQEEGKDVPESAVLQMKENFVIPEENSDLFNEIIFIELQRNEAVELVKKYNEEAKNQKKKDSNSDGKGKRDVNDENYGKWNSSPKSSEEAGPTAPKKSRWNDQSDSKRESRSRDRHDRASPESSSLPRKNDYKGGFCFSREASDNSRGGSRTGDGGFRSDSRHAGDKSRDQRERSGNRSSNPSYRKPIETNDRRPKFDRDESRFGNRNPMQANRDSRPRDRGSESRGAGQFQGRERSRGGFSDRRQADSYDNVDSRNKFPSTNYNDRNAGIGGGNFGNQERGRFPIGGQSERGDFRGRGRGGMSGSNMGKDSFIDRRNVVPENRDYQNYQEFNQFPDNRQTNAGWQSDYKEDSNIDRRSYGGDSASINRSNQAPSYDQPQYGGSRNVPMQTSGARGKPVDKIPNPYDRKPVTAARAGFAVNRGGARGGFSSADSYSTEDYSYGTNKGYDAPTQKFAAKSYGDQTNTSYKEPIRSDTTQSFGNPKPARGGYSRFGDAQKPHVSEVKSDTGRGDYSNMQQTNSVPYDNYQSYDNSQYQNQNYYNYYTGDSIKDQSVQSASAIGGGASTYQQASNPSANRAPYQYQSSNTATPAAATGSNYQSLAANPAPTNMGYQSSSGYGSNTANYPTNPTASASSGGYQGNYSSSGSAVAAAGATAGGYNSNNYPSTAAPYQSAYPSSNPTSGSGGYTNPYSAIYDNTSTYDSSYYGQTNTYAQSGSYGDNTVASKYPDFSAKPPMDRTMPPPVAATGTPAATAMPPQAPSSQNQASWGTGYGDYPQYYGQYYGQ